MLAGGAFSWLSKLQTVVALPMTIFEYMAPTQACKEAIWMQRLMEEFRHKKLQITVYCESQNALRSRFSFKDEAHRLLISFCSRTS